MKLTYHLVPLALAAALLWSCAAGTPAVPQPSAAAPAPAAADDSSRAVHGAALGEFVASPTPTPYDNKGVTASITLATNTMTENRMGLWNYLRNNPNASSNPSYGNDNHVVVTFANVPANASMSRMRFLDRVTGAEMDTVGAPTRGFMGVYGANNDLYNQFWNPGEALNVALSNVHLYLDGGAGAATINRGDAVQLEVNSSLGTLLFSATL